MLQIIDTPFIRHSHSDRPIDHRSAFGALRSIVQEPQQNHKLRRVHPATHLNG